MLVFMREKIWINLKVASRILLAIVGSYIIASLIALLPLALPISTISAITWGRIIAVVVACLIVLWVFLIRSLFQAWLMILTMIFVLFLLCWLMIPNFL